MPQAVSSSTVSARSMARPSPRQLLASVSAGALVLGMAMPQAAHAQLAQMRAAAGTVTVGTVATGSVAAGGTVRTATMQEAIARQQALQDRAKALAGYVTSARSAALAAIRTVPTDGISDKGLNPIAPVRAATLYVAAAAASTTVASDAPAAVRAANDPTGMATWEGARAPVQSTDSAGRVTVTIDQTQARALLSWNNFDVSANTTLVFSQKQNGVAQSGWTVVNRVVDARDPSVILGSIKADGTVLILNRSGVLFGPGAQVNLGSLVASSLELGNFASAVQAVGQKQFFVASTIKDRNTAFLQNGLLVAGVSSYKAQFLSALLPVGLYDVTSTLPVPATLEGDVLVYGGAQITTASGGMLVLAGPHVANAGSLSASDGQVSLQGGRFIGAVTSSGAASSVDPSVRGLIFSTQTPAAPTSPSDSLPDQGVVVNLGLVSSRRGYLSMGAGVFGTVENSGLLSATTSVSRNGKIALTAGRVTLTGDAVADHASGVVIEADTNGETIPQGSADSPAAFKTSQITIGASIASYLTVDGSGDVALLPSVFDMGTNAFIFAPSAKVVIGHDAQTGNFATNSAVKAAVTIAEGAVIDVSGLKGVSVDATRNMVTISPAKRNELRDTPNYRELSADGSFTLNGETLVVDPRRTGVRSDGVAWTGSSLLEAASAVSQIPVTAAELMTKAGTISIDIGAVTAATNLDAATMGAISIARNALFDISGGWVSYKGGYIASTRLITADGRIIDIADADPNDAYVDVANGFVSTQPRTGTTQTFLNALVSGTHYEAAYDEGRDAGALMVVGSRIAFGGTVKGDAFAGAYQVATSEAGTRASTIAGDPRQLQYTKYQLPAGGLLRIGAFSGTSDIGLGQDITVNYGGTGGDTATLALDAAMLSRAGLSALMLQTSGAIRLDRGVSGAQRLTLADGGILELDAGRTIDLAGDVRIAGGRIAARTYALSATTSAGIGTVGNPFRSDDDIALAYANAANAPHPFDLTVTGTLSTAGRWANDYLATVQGTALQGAAWIDGGAISLTVAPRAFAAVGTSAGTAATAVDLSGSLRIATGALLDVSAGGYVSAQRALDLTATGGDITLRNETTYATVVPILADTNDSAGAVVQGQGIAFTPVDATPTTVGVTPALVPAQQRSVVAFDAASLRGFGFTGGGTFRLVSPDVVFGSATGDAGATRIGLDFLARTGFGTLGVKTYHSRLIGNLFDNGSAGMSAFFDTTTFTVARGETLDLTQILLPTALDAAGQQALANLASGSSVLSVLTPAKPADAWFLKAASLELGGLIELDVTEGGTITGAARASIVTPKLYNAGTIVLHGGTIRQVAALPGVLAASGIGLVDKTAGGSGLDAVFGAADADGRYRLGATNTAGLLAADGSLQTNAQIFTTPGREHFLYFLGAMAADTGVLLAPGSLTDLSGTVLLDPTAPLRADGTRYRFGTVVAGGSLSTAAAYQPQTDTAYALFENPAYGFPAYPDPTSGSPTPPPQLAEVAARKLVARPGATIDISGVAATLDVAVTSTDYAPMLQWSNGGTLALLGGGSLSGAIVRAAGGAPKATGGTLEWLTPTIRASDDGLGADGVLHADLIARAGFATLIADGGLTLDGTFTLSLAKSLLVRSAPRCNEDLVGSNAAVTISATAGTEATITAPYVSLSSRSGSVSTAGAGSTVGDAAVRLAAGALGLDIAGGVLFDGTIGTTTLASAADIRLIGVDDRSDKAQLPVLNGSFVTAGDLTLDAARVYTTTGTGNLQRFLEAEAKGITTTGLSPFLLTALGEHTIRFLGSHRGTTTPLSAGSYLRISASRIEQDGFLAAPLGRLEFGTATAPVDSLVFGAGSVTSVSGGGRTIPYGTTTDLAEYYFTPGTSSPITMIPSGELRLTGRAITVSAGGTIDGTGGGDVFGYEFVSGTGGSRDILSRFNTDAFSANDYDAATGTGYQYADHRQVYALVPAEVAAKVALFDPLYAADYQGGSAPTDLYGVNAGLAVTLDGGGGIAAGQYVLMPAHYALLPGAWRIVENTGTAAPAAGAAQVQRDGSIVMGGSYGTAGTDLVESARHSFTVMSRETVLTYSRIETTSGTKSITDAAAAAGKTAPNVPLDAARVVLAPLASLKVEGSFAMGAATGGRGSEVDLLGSEILINHSGESTGTALVVSDSTLAKLNANSLLIGGTRTENSDDTTTLAITASRITVAGSARITAPEVVLAVAGQGSRLLINDGAQILATGTMADSRAGDYLIPSSTTTGSSFDQSGIGAVVRVSNGAERLVTRTGTVAEANTNRAATLSVGAATFGGQSLLLESSRTLQIDDGANLATRAIALESDALRFGALGMGGALEAKLAAADSVTLRSSSAILFDPNTTHAFHDLTLDAPSVALGVNSDGRDTLTINADNLRLRNSSKKVAGCSEITAPLCGSTGNVLTLTAQTVTLGSGTIRTYSFDGAVNITATEGMYYSGAGSLALGNAALTLTTPFLADRAALVDLSKASAGASETATPAGNYIVPETPNYALATSGAVRLVAPTPGAASAAPAVAGIRAPGAHLTIGSATAPVASLSIEGTSVTATAGVIDVRAQGTIALSGAATLATPGFARSYGDSTSSTTVSSGGGTVNLVSLGGDIVLPATATISVDNGTGNAGRLNVLAGQGRVVFDAMLNPSATGSRTASLTLDSGKGAFDLDRFAATYGSRFGGDVTIRSGVGDLVLGAGHALTASSIALDADGGSIVLAGTLDTSGADLARLGAAQAAKARVDGGKVTLWGMYGVSLLNGARIDTHTTGYADTDTRQAKAGDVTIGIGNPAQGGAIAIAAGATIDLSATRTRAAQAAGMTGNRLLPRTVKDPDSLVARTVYDFVEADQGGALTLRAPVLGADDALVDVRLNGAIVGAQSRTIEAYKTYDLDAIGVDGYFTGVTATNTAVFLDTTPDGTNLLSDSFRAGDGTASIPWFIQHFGVSAADGSSLAGMRLRPGVDIVSAVDIALVTNWNLAAGTVDTTRALADGLMTTIPELGIGPGRKPYLAVVTGREGDLLENYTSFLYRVGGKASGEAGVISLRAGGALDIAASISDGFFTFADKSDPTWINYQLGGGDRTYDPALLVSCGTQLDCNGLAGYADVASGAVGASADNTLTIGLSRYYQGSLVGNAGVAAPYIALNNAVTASGYALDPDAGEASGDALGFAQLFPLLSDGSAIRSTSLRFAAGTGGTASADPLHVDRATNANIIVEGGKSYGFTVSPGFPRVGSALDLTLAVAGKAAGAGPITGLSGLLASGSPASGLTADTYTAITWGNGDSGAAGDLRAAAEAFFAGRSATFTRTTGGIVTGVAAPLADMIAFLAANEGMIAAGIASGTSGYPTGLLKLPAAANFGTQVARTRTLVRTGDGSIDLAASGDLDLRNGTETTYRTETGVSSLASRSNNAQVGGTAIYTAGHRVSAAPVLANVVGTGALMQLAPQSPYLDIAAQDPAFLPSPKGLDSQAAVLATGGGAIGITTGGSVLARRDVWAETYLGSGASYGQNQLTSFDATRIGDASQRWRPGVVGQDTEIAIAPRHFTSGIGALAGGDIVLRAGGSVSDLTLALDNAVTTTSASVVGATGTATPAMMTLGRGTLDAVIGGDLLAGQFDIATGRATISVDGSVRGSGTERTATTADTVQYLRLRTTGAAVTLSAQGAVALAGVSALGAWRQGDALGKYNAAGFFTPEAGLTVTANGDIRYTGNRLDQTVPFQVGSGNGGIFGGHVLSPSLSLASLQGNLTMPALPMLLYPSRQGNLQLFSAGNLASLVLAMSDADRSLLPGAFSAAQINLDAVTASGAGNVTPLVGLGFGIPGVDITTTDRLLRLYHDEAITHTGDTTPVEIFAGNDISGSLLNLAKQARITAGRDIVNLYFTGQNVSAGDTTTITAGRDITGTTAASATANLPYVVSSNFLLGGPGTFQVQAGRDIGPFINSATVDGISYAGGIQTVGNDANPWLTASGADLTVLFGVAKGIAYGALAATYLDPAHAAQLDGDLFEQVTDVLGNNHPDRSKPIYAPVLATWLRSHAPEAFAALFGAGSYPDTEAGNAALKAASYARMADLYAAFSGLDPLLRQSFLIKQLYFNELQQTPSIRAYRAIDTLFPAKLGYTDNLAAFTTDPATVDADHPQGKPVRILVDGQPKVATQVVTGSIDLRLATLETTRGGDITILGPGGTFIGGSVVRTSEQATRRVTRFGVGATSSLAYGQLTNANVRAIDAIPIGYEGVLTLRGGNVYSFTDGSFLVNQSRVFTIGGGNIVMFSGNGDLNAGQGPRSASNFPPVTVRFDLDGHAEVDSAGSVSGAGIGAFKPSPDAPASSVSLVAPVGTVDAGDAGVRASGDVIVIAARVTNADAISSSSGSISGVPSSAPSVVATPAGANAAVAAQAGGKTGSGSGDKRSVITVDVRGFVGSDACSDPNDPGCKTT